MAFVFLLILRANICSSMFFIIDTLTHIGTVYTYTSWLNPIFISFQLISYTSSTPFGSGSTEVEYFPICMCYCVELDYTSPETSLASMTETKRNL